MQYVLKKPYRGITISGEQVDLAEAEVFDTFEGFIAKGDLLICRVGSEVAKQYFSAVDEVTPDTEIAEEQSVASDTLTQLAMTLDSLEVN